MFAQSRFARPKINWYSPVWDNQSWLNEGDRLRRVPNQAKLSMWEFWLFKTLIFWSEINQSRQRQNLKSRFGLHLYGLLFLLAILFVPTLASAQSFEPLTPDRDPPPTPEPLPPANDPLDSLSAPPLPESVLDILGTIVVREFEFTGNTAFSQAQLKKAIASLTGEPISFAQLVQAANLITEFYVSQGYITSGAYLPEQQLDSGIVQIQIIEGRIDEIDVEITKGRLNQSYIRDRITNRISTPLNINQLQESLQLLQLNPLIDSLDAELSAGIKPGTNSLAVSVIQADTFSLETRFNNNRNPSIGTFERGVKLEEGNLFGIGDNIFVAYANTDGSNQYEGGYSLPINARDGVVSFDFRLAQNEIVETEDLERADIDIESRNYSLTWRQPVIQIAKPDVSQELALSLSASRRESDTSILDIPQGISPGANNQGEIRTSTLSLGQEWLQRNPKQVIAASSQFNLGIDAFDATVSNNEPDSQFFNWRGQVSYLRLLSNPRGNPAIGSTILLRSQLQLSLDTLIPTEQFSLGGAATVRGYRQDALLTDNGFSVSAELRLPIARFSPLGATLQFSPFVDFGTGWNSDGEETEFNTLLGTGIGFSLQTKSRFSARIDWGIPVINNDSDDGSIQEDGVYLQLQYRLF